jgi:predicted DNA binding CopG/RHH family protein
MNRKKMPQTDSIQELAKFWDTHDLTDFENELEEVEQPVSQRETVVEIHLPSKEVKAARKIAKSKGIDFPELIRQWILERIQKNPRAHPR